MAKRVAMITTYNPGAAGPRFVAGSLVAAGYDVKFFHLKELRAVAVPTTDFERHEELRAAHKDIQYVAFQHPGEVLYVPYPSPISDREMELLYEEIRAYDPQLVGITMFTVTVEIARRVTAFLHERMPGLPIIWGGIHCMVKPDDCLKGLAPGPDGEPANPLQVPDIICAGEGEIPTVALMNQWDAYIAGEVPEIPGLWFVKGTEVHRCAPAGFENDLDKFPFPVYAKQEVLIDQNKIDHKFEEPQGWIQNHIFVFTERGCPYSCSFCIHSVINKMENTYRRIRRRSVENVIDEMAQRVKENGMKHLVIHDEIFAIQKKWVMDFAAEYKKRLKPLGVTFTGYVHPLTSDLDMVEALFEAGMTNTGIGLQTGSERTSKEVYDRPLHRDKVLLMSEYLAKFPFENVSIDVLSDSRYETDDDRFQTLELLLDMTPPFQVETYGIVTYPITELANKKPLVDHVPWQICLFWNMLYHLAGIPWMKKETVVALSKMEGFKEDPLPLEALVRDIHAGLYKRLPGQLRLEDVEAEAAANLAAEAANAAAHATGNAPGPAAKPWKGYRFKSILKETVKSVLGR